MLPTPGNRGNIPRGNRENLPGVGGMGTYPWAPLEALYGGKWVPRAPSALPDVDPKIWFGPGSNILFF